MSFTELQSQRQKLLDKMEVLLEGEDLEAICQAVEELDANTEQLLANLPAIFQSEHCVYVAHARGDGYQVSTFSPQYGLLNDCHGSNLMKVARDSGIIHLPIRGEEEVEALLLQAIKAEVSFQERLKGDDELRGSLMNLSF